MKRHNVILESNVEPKDKNVLWLHGKKLKKFGNTGWEDIGNEALALGAFHGYFPDSSSLPADVTTPGYAYVGLGNPYKIWKFNGELWSDSGTSIDMNDADEEDITRNTEGKLQFKDRAYGDGLGYVILRKDKTFAEQVTQANTIYEIRYDFNNIGTINLKPNCVLKFIGGHVSNGIIKGDNTTIEGAEYGALDNVILTGSYTNSESDLSWWGCIPYTETNQFNNSYKIEYAINSSIRVINVSKNYGLSRPVKLNGGKKIKGTVNPSEGYKICGFVANNDFSFIEYEAHDSKTYQVKGLLFYDNATHIMIEHIVLQCKYKAGYGFEHISGYANINLSFIDIYDAFIAGIVHYGCEKILWETVVTRNCRIGAFISSTRIVEDNPYADGDKVAANDMVVLSNCRFVGGNYGFVSKSGTNFSFYSCETAENSLFGLYLKGACHYISDFYSERDGFGNFYIDENGTKIYSDKDGNPTTDLTLADLTKVSPALISKNIDGFLVRNDFLIEGDVYSRSVFVFDNTHINMNSIFVSFHPRSYVNGNITVDEREKPIIRNAHGIDSFITLISTTNDNNSSEIQLNSFYPIGHPNALPTSALPYYTIIDNTKSSSITYRGEIQCNIGFFVNSGKAIDSYRIEPFNDIVSASVFWKRNIDILDIGKRYPNFNKKVSIYGINPIYKFNQSEYKLSYKGIPLYRRATDKKNFNSIVFTKEELFDILKYTRSLRVIYVLYVVDESVDTLRSLVALSCRTSSWTVLSQYGSNRQLAKKVYPGFYVYDDIISIPYKDSFKDTVDKLIIQIVNDDEENKNIYCSDIYISIPEDPNIDLTSKEVQNTVGTTNERPFVPAIGQEYFDTTLKKKIVWSGTAWINLDGTAL